MNDDFHQGFLQYVVPAGTPGYVQQQFSLKVKEVAKEIAQIVKVLEGEGYGIWTIARSSTARKLDIQMSLC